MKIFNKRAKFDYILQDKVEAGISLTGAEVKAIRLGHASLAQSYAKIIGGELYLINANILSNGDNTRSRKLLIHRSQLTSIISQLKAKKLTVVPTMLYTKGPRIKVEVALAKTKQQFEKRESIKKHDLELELARELGENKQN
jgi:SsrA-binding protein